MMMKRGVSLFLLLLLTGCSASEEIPVQKAQQGKMSPERSLNMEGSYELKGYTARKEGFVCSFDADGQFLHLSMR